MLQHKKHKYRLIIKYFFLNKIMVSFLRAVAFGRHCDMLQKTNIQRIRKEYKVGNIRMVYKVGKLLFHSVGRIHSSSKAAQNIELLSK